MVRTVPAGAVRIRQGQHLLLITRNVHASHIAGARAQGVYDDGTDFSFYVESAILATDRSQELWYSNEAATQDGWITQAYAGSFQAVTRAQRGETWAELYTVQGKDPSQARAYLCRGYIQTAHNIVLGETQIAGPGGGHGFETGTATDNPAAGVQHAAQSVPTGAVWRIKSYRELVTAFTAAAKSVSIQVVQVGTGNTVILGSSVNFTPAAAAGRILAAQAANVGLDTVLNAVNFGLADYFLVAGDTFAVVVNGIAGGDDLATGTYFIEEWVVP